MKNRIISVVAALLATVAVVQAQSRVGVLAGLTSSSANVAEFKASSVSQYHLGVAFHFPVGVGFAIQPQVLYQVKGTSIDQIHSVQDISSQKMDVKVGYVELPVQIQWGPDLMAFRPYAFAEPFIGFGVNMKSEYSADKKVLETVTNAFKDADLSRFEYGLGLGAGLEAWRMQLSLKYFWNFGSLSSEAGKVDTRYIGQTVRDAFKDKRNFNGMMLSLAYFF